MAERIQQFHNLSSWREQDIKLSSGVNTIDFIDTQPNHFILVNNTQNELKISIGSIPTPLNFEFECDKVSTKTFGRPTATRQIYILNMESTEITVKLFSIFKSEFDVNIVKDTNVSIDSDLQVTTDGLVKGFQSGVSLPSGNNTIGRVSLQDDVNESISIIKNASSQMDTNISNVKTKVAAIEEDSSSMVDLLRQIEENTTKVPGINGDAETMTDSLLIRHLYNMGDCYNIDPIYLNKVNTMTYTAVDKCKVHFNYLLNDGAEFDIVKAYTNAEGEEVSEVLLSVYPNEQLTDIEIEVETDATISINSQGTFRCKYFVY